MKRSGTTGCRQAEAERSGQERENLEIGAPVAVDVVPHATHRVRNTVHSTNDATEVIMNTRAPRGRKPRFPAFRAEDQVIVQRNMGRGHDANLSRSWPERNRLLLPKSGGFAALHHRLPASKPSA